MKDMNPYFPLGYYYGVSPNAVIAHQQQFRPQLQCEQKNRHSNTISVPLFNQPLPAHQIPRLPLQPIVPPRAPPVNAAYSQQQQGQLPLQQIVPPRAPAVNAIIAHHQQLHLPLQPIVLQRPPPVNAVIAHQQQLKLPLQPIVLPNPPPATKEEQKALLHLYFNTTYPLRDFCRRNSIRDSIRQQIDRFIRKNEVLKDLEGKREIEEKRNEAMEIINKVLPGPNYRPPPASTQARDPPAFTTTAARARDTAPTQEFISPPASTYPHLEWREDQQIKKFTSIT
jgi:hypothetical protein